MSDDFGIRKSGRRRRTTRRLLRHAARQASEGTLAAASSAGGTTESTDHETSAPREIAAAEHDDGVCSTEAAAVSAQVSPAEISVDVAIDVADTTVPIEIVPPATLQPSSIDVDVIESSLPPVSFDEDVDTGMHAAAALRAPVAGELALQGERSDDSSAEVKTRPKIRFPAESGAGRRHSPRPPIPQPPAVANGQVLSPLPPTAAGVRAPSVVPPAAQAAPPRSDRPLTSPTGEGIIRQSSLPPGRSLPPSAGGDGAEEGPDLISDVPTRPRIQLTPDMALAAGRVTSLDVPRHGDDSPPTVPRIARPGSESRGSDPEPAVVVTRSRVISDHPPESDVSQPERSSGRPSRRHRPDSEEFEMLDLDDDEQEEAAETLELSGALAEARGAEVGPRVSRTPPPPPTAQPARRAAAPSPPRGAAPPPPPPGVAAKKPERVERNDKAEKSTGAAAPKAQGRRRGWWDVLFSDDYVRTLPRPSQVQIAKQVAFMETSFGISRGDAVLDVGCGLGHHALEFARRGYLVVALDLALSMITRAAESAQQQGLRINFLHKDIRDIGFEGTFDAIVCVGTTFGFFDDEQNRGVLLRLANALKPGGRLLLDVVNRDYVVASQPNLVWFEGEGCVVMEESDFNFYTSRLNVKRTMMRDDGRQTESEYSVRLYSVHELGQMLKQAGFGIKEVSGQEATPGLFFGCNSGRIIMLAERRAGARVRGDSTPPE